MQKRKTDTNISKTKLKIKVTNRSLFHKIVLIDFNQNQNRRAMLFFEIIPFKN